MLPPTLPRVRFTITINLGCHLTKKYNFVLDKIYVDCVLLKAVVHKFWEIELKKKHTS